MSKRYVAFLGFCAGIAVASILFHARDQLRTLTPAGEIPQAEYIYRTTDAVYQGWPVQEIDGFVGSPPRCWISEQGICSFDDTGVKVPGQERETERP